MRALTETRVFNRSDRVVRTWYWAMASADVPRGTVKPLRMLGRELVLWRGDDGSVHAMDAYCPHMGAHLAEGRVDHNGIRCFFHAWKFDGEGRLVDIPCQDHVIQTTVRTWPVEEAYGMIWVWPGPEPEHPVPFVPELHDLPLRWAHGNRFVKGCHPNVVMVNAIDEQHFASVHDLVVDLHFDIEEVSDTTLTFDNTTPLPDDHVLTRLAGRFYEGPLTYRMTYWGGTNGSVTVGPDLWHFHILFALRPGEGGCTEGQTILLTPRVGGVPGWIWNRVALGLSQVVGDYFAKGDTEVFQTIRWRFDNPIKADRSIIQFVKHLERQPTIPWATWADEPDSAPVAEVGRGA